MVLPSELVALFDILLGAIVGNATADDLFCSLFTTTGRVMVLRPILCGEMERQNLCRGGLEDMVMPRGGGFGKGVGTSVHTVLQGYRRYDLVAYMSRLKLNLKLRLDVAYK
jgi:hypothetical protein